MTFDDKKAAFVIFFQSIYDVHAKDKWSYLWNS
jgi:hypothetical protein